MARKKYSKYFYIVYETTNNVSGSKYIGVHKCGNINDSYLGSGYAMKDAIKSYGRKAFTRKVLFIFENEDEAFNKEKELVTEEIIKNDNYYNICLGGKHRPNAESTKIKLRQRPKRECTGRNLVAIKAINLTTEEVLSFNSILACCKFLDLSYSAVLKVCKRRYGMTRVGGWTFETSKYGKALSAKKVKLPGINQDRKGKSYNVYYGKIYLGRAETEKKAITIQKEHMKTLSINNKRDLTLKKKYETAHNQKEPA